MEPMVASFKETFTCAASGHIALNPVKLPCSHLVDGWILEALSILQEPKCPVCSTDLGDWKIDDGDQKAVAEWLGRNTDAFPTNRADLVAFVAAYVTDQKTHRIMANVFGLSCGHFMDEVTVRHQQKTGPVTCLQCNTVVDVTGVRKDLQFKINALIAKLAEDLGFNVAQNRKAVQNVADKWDEVGRAASNVLAQIDRFSQHAAGVEARTRQLDGRLWAVRKDAHCRRMLAVVLIVIFFMHVIVPLLSNLGSLDFTPCEAEYDPFNP